MFVHLHNHSDGSVADAILKPEALAKAAAADGQIAVALTDHGNMFKIPNFYKACQKEGVKPILGMEAYVTPKINTMKKDRTDAANYHLVLLCETDEGYRNLTHIASNASLEGFYYKPRTDTRKLKEFHKGLICLSACLGGEVQVYIQNDDYKKAKETALMYDEIFGRGNYFLELQDHGIKADKKVIEGLLKIHEETGIPLVATNDCHYLLPEHAKAHDVLLCIRDKEKFSSETRMRYDSDQMYFKSQEEMEKLFSFCPEAIENTVKIAERCNVELDFGHNKIPPFDTPEGFTTREYLEKLTFEGAKRKYGEITEEVKSRILFELDTIERMGFLEYFLIVWDFLKYARSIGILPGSGRGSAAGSCVCYCLDIVQVDPIKYNLLFERFLDPSRISPPDVDIDWQDDRRQEGIDYVIKKYGEKSVCQIITFGNMKAKGVLRDVARVLEYPAKFQDKLAKFIPFDPKATIEESLKESQEFSDAYKSDEDVKKVVDIALVLEGVTKSIGKHAAGILITDNKGVENYVPVWQTKEGIVAQYDKDILEELGLLKMDFLGLSTLTVIADAIKNIEKNYGRKIDILDLYKGEDTKPYELIAEGKTDGIFQLESPGMTKFMQELRPNSIEELTAGVSLFRPGPAQFIPQFIANKKNPKNIKYEFPELKPILEETYGILCYQEQCMRTVIALGGYQKHHSDGFRKAIA